MACRVEGEKQNSATQLGQVCGQWKALISSSPALRMSFIIDIRESYISRIPKISSSISNSVFLAKRTPVLNARCYNTTSSTMALVFPVVSCKACSEGFLLRLMQNMPDDGWWKRIARLESSSDFASVSSWFKALMHAFDERNVTLDGLRSLDLGSRCPDSRAFPDETGELLATAPGLRHLILVNYHGSSLPAWNQQTVELEHVGCNVAA
ncbi:hypothetical protein C8J56DRAFT_196891 [Mycena floridula]|nr:hypothetical protein C8J56DRAFT_196891 [Mycena floridula]